MKIFQSIVDENIMKCFKEVKGKTLMNHAANSCGLENTLSIASIFCPKIILVEDYIFISEFYNGDIESLKSQFNNDKKQIEMFVNSWSLADFFLLGSDYLIQIDEAVSEFGKVLKYFWDIRFAKIFPDRKIVVQLGDNILGERGLTITVFEDLS